MCVRVCGRVGVCVCARLRMRLCVRMPKISKNTDDIGIYVALLKQ